MEKQYKYKNVNEYGSKIKNWGCYLMSLIFIALDTIGLTDIPDDDLFDIIDICYQKGFIKGNMWIMKPDRIVNQVFLYYGFYDVRCYYHSYLKPSKSRLYIPDHSPTYIINQYQQKDNKNSHFKLDQYDPDDTLSLGEKIGNRCFYIQWEV